MLISNRWGLFLFLMISLVSSGNIFAQFKTNTDKFEFYKNKYKVSCANEKITDNKGDGFDELYGTRNMRTILYGVAYRGGANNFFHNSNKRDNHNPLPEDGLLHLLENGFSEAVYLYSTNFAQSKNVFVSKDNKDTLLYIQNSGNSRPHLKKLMLQVLDIIKKPELGPIYLHCWNGWHQSGYVSAAILMQFCNISNEEAYNYWINNTDGVNKGYENVKSQVKNFKKFDDIKIDEKTRNEICPCLKK